MYEHNGEQYFVVDGHVHYWNAAPDNWVAGQEVYAKGWIDCFYAYHGLGPAETHWPYEQYQRYDADLMMRHLFDEGHVDVAIFQPTYLKQWYTEGFNTTERNAVLAEQHPDRFVLNGAWDPRAGDAGLEEFEAKVERYGLKGVKLYTAEWRGDSRGWSLKSDEAARYLQACERLGVTNIHVHKGPTIWPLDKDAFDVADVDFAATNFPALNFVVEHVGLPRIEDFCFMATQEPNVYAGLAVVIGGLMHARPRMFAKVMGELMFWLGEDRLVFASDYAIWEPKWQVEGFAAWNMPEGEEFSDYSPLTTAGQEEDLRAQRRPAVRPRRPDDTAHPGGRAGSPGAVVIDPSPVLAALDTVRDPELDTSIVELGFVTACSVDDDGTARVRLRLPTFFCAPNFAFLMVADAYDAVARRRRRHAPSTSCWRTTSPPRRSTPAWPPAPASSPRSTVSPRASSTTSAASSSARPCSPPRIAWLRPLLAAGVRP